MAEFDQYRVSQKPVQDDVAPQEAKNDERKEVVWTPEENKKLLEGLETFGKNYDKIVLHLGGSKSLKQLLSKMTYLRMKFRKNPSLPGASILKKQFGVTF